MAPAGGRWLRAQGQRQQRPSSVLSWLWEPSSGCCSGNHGMLWMGGAWNIIPSFHGQGHILLDQDAASPAQVSPVGALSLSPS